MLKRDVPGIKSRVQPKAPSDGPGIKNPMYKGKSARTVSGETDMPIRTMPVGGFKPVGGDNKPGRGGGFGPGGRFGKGGWQRKSRNAAFSYTDRQNAAAEEKRKRQTELKKKSAAKRIGGLKKGPNDKQNQLLGGE